MSKFQIRVLETADKLYEVEAQTAEEAREIYLNGVTDLLGYMHPSDPDVLYPSYSAGLVPVRRINFEETDRRLVLLDEEVTHRNMEVGE